MPKVTFARFSPFLERFSISFNATDGYPSPTSHRRSGRAQHPAPNAFDARLADMHDCRRLLGEILQRLSSSAESRSYVVMEEIKETSYMQV